MADRIRVTSVILASLPRGEQVVPLGGGRRLARSGHLDLRAQAEVPSALRPDTPTLVSRVAPCKTAARRFGAPRALRLRVVPRRPEGVRLARSKAENGA